MTEPMQDPERRSVWKLPTESGIVATREWAKAFAPFAAIAATVAAVGAFLQLENARLTSQRQLRAYVYVDAIKFDDVKEGKIPASRIVFKNFGQTPAFDLRVLVRTQFVELPLPRSRIEAKADPDTIPKIILGANNTLFDRRKVEGEPTLVRADLVALSERRKALFVSGFVNYRDVFGVRRHYRFSGVNDPPDDEGQASVAVSDYGADEEIDSTPSRFKVE